MTSKMNATEALVRFLDSIPDEQRPEHFEQLRAAAANVTEARQAGVISALLGPAVSFGSDTPQAKLIFPRDHLLHLNMGTEWYWLSFNVTVEGTDGCDRISGFATVKRVRSVSPDVQRQAGWTDVEAQIGATTATLTFATREHCEIVRRRPNIQWAALGGDVEFGEFLFRNGPDFLKGSANVLPLVVHIDDAPNMIVDVTMSSPLPEGSAFFEQADKYKSAGAGAGFYYSWPQLTVEGSITVDTRTYKVHGSGWICHQMMMLLPPDPAARGVTSTPNYAPTASVNGWSWCQFNLENGDAFTAVAVQSGTLRDTLLVPYGWYVRRNGDEWLQTYLTGFVHLDRFVPGLEGVLLPSAWRYTTTDLTGGRQIDAELLAVPWYPDGSFSDFDLQVQGETAVDVALTDYGRINTQTGSGRLLTGSGYCESVSYEPEERYVERALAYLKCTS
jgi:hypothetical protein